MKNILFTLVLLFGVSAITAQDSKFYLGVGAGYATAGDDVNSDNNYRADTILLIGRYWLHYSKKKVSKIQ